ncbi:response regulator [Dermatophilus congolensis]|uniref:response regulator n=1 Tax=Dermatophilus congolensis TaxID=1863 RepID=UPI001AAE2F88|nr:response regulator transcription factor [Dermatophilus congolensis]MBO3151222.1 response regulator transcription factor [Dermatophilus congolensis]MBO3161776.1 response regulator transcription factor [Dermatophilus congolensis]MBO3162508.1 response regulator transcription factor [Dermatophilus congolensis]MBO3176061.1 response regulator transcription factor [Dermatophilus congolensis]
MSEPIRLLLADDQALVRAGFRMVLDAQPDMVVVGEVGDGAAAVAAVAGPGTGVDVVLMDIRMPVLDGVGATRRIVESGSATKVLVLTTFDLDEYVHAALHAGASGFLLKDAGPAELLAAIRAVFAGDAVVAPSATRRLLERFLPGMGNADSERSVDRERVLAPLTDREREVLVAVGQGMNNAEISANLFMAEATVKTHIGRILSKLGLRDRVQMVVLAYDTGLVRPRRGDA